MKNLAIVVLVIAIYSSAAVADHGRGGGDRGRSGGHITLGSALVVLGGLYLLSRIDNTPSQQPAYQPSCGGGYIQPMYAVPVLVRDRASCGYGLVTPDGSPIRVYSGAEYDLMQLDGQVRVARVRVQYTAGGCQADVSVCNTYREFHVGDQLLLVPASRDRN
ncbi:MAG: hypothetical protein NTY30_00655 [Candidatus Berkelbacteria bacterium]|nr:hypothetical protein [Candidatus Berkelbacteria bacterium]